VGTIEPRKNHGFLLDVWAALVRDGAGPMPQLLICGTRGWLNAEVFARLDGDPMMGRDVFEVSGLDDAQLALVMTGARALLFPSRAEGFGLPAAEAVAMGVPAICNDLPVYREILGDNPVYAGVDDIYPWHKKITDIVADGEARRNCKAGGVPTWDGHFNTVLKKLV
jgi:glycosyltransferase involved in cell wall biosynthesis